MINLFEEYPAQDSKQSSREVNLFDEYNPNNRIGTKEEALELAKKQISQKYPNLPDWLRDSILKITPTERSPMLESAARGVSNVTDYIPAGVGGFLQGASLPIRGIASTIPTEFTQKLANSPDLSEFFQHQNTGGQNAIHDTAEFFGALGPLGKLFGGLKTASQAAKIPKALQNATALAGTGYLGTPGDTTDKTIGAAGSLALGGIGKVAGKALQKIPPFMRGLFNEATPEALIESVQKPHDILQKTADELYGQVKQAINKRGIKFSNTTPKKNFDKFESGNIFGVTANPENTELPNNLVSMINRGDGRAVVIDAKVKDAGKGLGTSLYKEAINEAKNKGLRFESDDVVSESALNVYKKLEKEGYKFKFNKDFEKINREDGQVAYRSKNDDEPMVKLISSPSEKPTALQNLIDQSAEHFPKNARSYKELLKKAKEGDYDAIHKIQSSLYKKGTKALSSDDLAMENQGEDILDLREKINEELNNHLIKEGHIDIAHVLKQGRKVYSDLQKTYYDKLLPKGIGKLVHPETRLIPENVEDLFKQNSVAMKRFLKKHPESAKNIQGIKEKKLAKKELKSLLYKTGGTGATIAGGKAIYDLFK